MDDDLRLSRTSTQSKRIAQRERSCNFVHLALRRCPSELGGALWLNGILEVKAHGSEHAEDDDAKA